MSEDPLNLGGLEPELIEQTVARPKGKEKIKELNAVTASKKEERIAGKETGRGASQIPAPPGPTPPPPPPPVDRSELLDKLLMYRERFPDLKSRNKISGKTSVDEMEDELHYFEHQLGTQSGNLSGNLFVAAMTGLEVVSTQYFNPLNLNLQGLGSIAKDNVAEMQPILDELVIKYGVNMCMSPEMRLVTTVATMVYTVHAANSGDSGFAQALGKMNQPAKTPVTDL